MTNLNATIEPDRVRRNTSAEQLEAIDQKIEQNVRFYASQPREVISARIAELDREWSMERLLETNASVISLMTLLLGATKSKAWFLATGVVAGFLLQHAIQGWCPPVPVMRRLGVRTRGEIDREKYALKALRGDFQNIDLQPRENLESATANVLRAVSA